MLAEPRNKQKWSADPRNTHWASDTSKFGYQMMSKMGWSEGKGLGAKEDGNVSHVKVSKKNNNLGVGAKISNEDNWLSHQDDFNSLLNSLNKNNGTDRTVDDDKPKSLEATAKKSKTKIFYSKFLKSKDLSRASKDDMDSILGNRSKSAPSTPQNGSDDESGNDSENSAASLPASSQPKAGFVTSTSNYSMKDYFAEKMAKRNSSSNPPSPVIVQDDENMPLIVEDDEVVITDSIKKKKSKKNKRNREDDEIKTESKKSRKEKQTNDCEITNVVTEVVTLIDTEQNDVKRKKKKKDKKQKKQSKKE